MKVCWNNDWMIGIIESGALLKVACIVGQGGPSSLDPLTGRGPLYRLFSETIVNDKLD